MIKTILIAISIFYLTSCCTRKPAQSDEEYNAYWRNLKYVEGEIFLPEGMAGCSYLIKLNENRTLEPINLADSLKKEKLKLWVLYHHEKKMSSVCMMGDIVTLDDVQIRR